MYMTKVQVAKNYRISKLSRLDTTLIEVKCHWTTTYWAKRLKILFEF